jgi:hypothetical protein
VVHLASEAVVFQFIQECLVTNPRSSAVRLLLPELFQGPPVFSCAPLTLMLDVRHRQCTRQIEILNRFILRVLIGVKPKSVGSEY